MIYMKIIHNGTYDLERSFYGTSHLVLENCSFEGPNDGESALKECNDIVVENCNFNLRYPFWHNNGLKIINCEMSSSCRAPIWYSQDIHIFNSKIHGVKALRECSDIVLDECDIHSHEFGWFSSNISSNRCKAEGEYLLLRSNRLRFKNFELHGKYSFQYIENSVFENCIFDTKDAFWHANNIYVKNCKIKGEYLAWYCENVTFENCTITGTQPLCYCKGLKLINCTLKKADLAFEKSEVDATVSSHIISIKNPLSGKISAPSVGEIIIDEDWAKGEIIIR